MAANFIREGNDLHSIPKGTTYELENGKVYDLEIKEIWGRVVTKFKINGELNLPPNVYQTKRDKMLIKRVLNDFNNGGKNTTGVLLTGDKGTGKSVTAKLLAKEANLPVIIIKHGTEEQHLSDFFKNFDTPVCILFDEVDKGFNTQKMLTFLDGMEKTAKKLVVMTANDEDNLSNFIKNRCSRIRYYRHYNMYEDAKEYAELICAAKNIDNAKEVVKFICNNIKFPSIDNISSFVDEIIATKEDNLTLAEVLVFMNINVGEDVKPDSDDDDCAIYFDDENEDY